MFVDKSELNSFDQIEKRNQIMIKQIDDEGNEVTRPKRLFT